MYPKQMEILGESLDAICQLMCQLISDVSADVTAELSADFKLIKTVYLILVIGLL